MARKTMTPERYQEIKRLIKMGISVKKICVSMKATKRTVQAIRDGKILDPANIQPKAPDGPIWTSHVPWQEIYTQISSKDSHPLKFAWQDFAQEYVSYTGFLRQFYKRFPDFKSSFSTSRDIPMGQQCEVDYMGFTPEWVELKTGEIYKAVVFVGTLCGSQLIFACAKANATSANFIDCHVQMYADFGGVPHVTVPDNLKTGVIKAHTFDPTINQSYADMAKHYDTAIVPARVRRPKDKPIVEGAVRIVTRLFKWRYRNHTFTSLDEINMAFKKVVKEINNRAHARFKVSRHYIWENEELDKLKRLPTPYVYFETKKAKVHPDSHITLGGHLYSVPFHLLGRQVVVKFNSKQVRIFYKLESIAIHNIAIGRKGQRVTNINHLPENAKAYLTATPQAILSLAKRMNIHLYQLIERMFQQDALGNIRRAQGMINETRKEFSLSGRRAPEIIEQSIAHMIEINRLNVPVYQNLLSQFRKAYSRKKTSSIERKNNPMLRYKQMELNFAKENNDGKSVVH